MVFSTILVYSATVPQVIEIFTSPNSGRVLFRSPSPRSVFPAIGRRPFQRGWWTQFALLGVVIPLLHAKHSLIRGGGGGGVFRAFDSAFCCSVIAYGQAGSSLLLSSTVQSVLEALRFFARCFLFCPRVAFNSVFFPPLYTALKPLFVGWKSLFATS